MDIDLDQKERFMGSQLMNIKEIVLKVKLFKL